MEWDERKILAARHQQNEYKNTGFPTTIKLSSKAFFN